MSRPRKQRLVAFAIPADDTTTPPARQPEPNPETDQLHVAFEYAAYPPLWWHSDDPSQRATTAPRLPELTSTLLTELNEWVGFATSHLILDDGMPDGDRTIDEWCAEGSALARRVRVEVNREFEVWFVDPVSQERTRID